MVWMNLLNGICFTNKNLLDVRARFIVVFNRHPDTTVSVDKNNIPSKDN